MGQIAFAIQCASDWVKGADLSCPYCGCRNTARVAIKRIVLQLRKCPNCGLQFRAPKASREANDAFYQEDYTEGMTTEVPDDRVLAQMKAKNFPGQNLSYTTRGIIAAIRSVCPSGRVLDYGASWGYGVYQLRTAGYDAEGFEISRPRAAFGIDKLKVKIVSDPSLLPDGAFDVVHSAHVLEHIPDPNGPLSDFARLVRPGGHVVFAVPNGAGPSAQQMGVRWTPMIGEAHLMAFTADFMRRAFADYGFEVVRLEDADDELRLIARKTLSAVEAD